MKDYRRAHPQFSLCGLNCALCAMHVGGYCPGCGGGEGNQPCAIVRCALAHGAVEYCCACGDYPCARYESEPEYDLFIPSGNRRRDLERARRMGLEAYHAELAEKADVLLKLLQDYNDGRRKTLFCAAVNLLSLEDLRAVMAQLSQDADASRTLKEKAAQAAALLQAAADAQGVSLKLRKKPKAK